MSVSITNSEQLKAALANAVNGDRSVLFAIGKYIAYNYYMCFHIKEGSEDDLQNEILYQAFKKEHPELFAEVEGVVDYEYSKWKIDDDDF